MVNLKPMNKRGQIVIKALLSRDESISSRELDQFYRKYIRGFLKPRMINAHKIEYTCDDHMVPIDRLTLNLTPEDFYYLVAQVLCAVCRINRNNLFVNKLVMDFRYVYVNVLSMEVYFLYLPITSSCYYVDTIDFVTSIAFLLAENMSEDSKCAMQLVDSLKGFRTSYIDEAQDYIYKQSPSIAAKMRKQNLGQSEYIADKSSLYDPPIMRTEYQNVPTNPYDDNATRLIDDSDLVDQEYGDYLKTTLLDDDATTVLQDSVGSPQSFYPTLKRVSTGEVISIYKPVFRIGKERSYVDYFVANNNTVSRSHADIIVRGSKIFVIDHNSKNKTYVNNMMIVDHCEVEIHNGDLLRLSNEEFVVNK